MHKETLRWAGLFVGTIAIAALIVPSFMESAHQGHTAPTPATSQPPHSGGHDSHSSHSALTPEQSIATALQHRAEGHFPEALEVLDQAIRTYPDNADLYSVRGRIRLEQNLAPEALQDLEAAAKRAPLDLVALVNRGLAYQRVGRDQEALRDMEKAVAIDPDFIAARFNRGVLYHSQGKFKEALADFDHCIAKDSRQAAPYFNRATTHEALGQKEEAIADLKRFIERSNSEKWKETAQRLLDKLEGRGAPEDRQGKNVPGDSYRS